MFCVGAKQSFLDDLSKNNMFKSGYIMLYSLLLRAERMGGVVGIPVVQLDWEFGRSMLLGLEDRHHSCHN